MPETAPNPGSDEAIAAGCRCPVMGNGHGEGVYGGRKSENGETMFWVSDDCPLHGPVEGAERSTTNLATRRSAS